MYDFNFETYENYQNKHICIHKIDCMQLHKRGGFLNYHQFKTLVEAESYAKSTELPIIYCSTCNPMLSKQ